MTTHLRRTFVATVLVLSFIGLWAMAGDAQSTAGGGAGAPAQSPAPLKPEVKAYNDAVALTDPAARLAALEKICEDFPQASNMAQVDSALLSTLANNFSDRTDSITAVFDRIIGRVPADANVSDRANQILGPISVVTNKKLLLDRSTKLLTDVTAALDKDKFADLLKENNAKLSRPAPTQASIDQQFNQLNSRVQEQLGRVYVAKGDQTKAEAAYKEAVKTSPSYGTAHIALVDLYTAKSDFASGEALLKDVIKALPAPPENASAAVLTSMAAVAARPKQALADLYIKKGDDASAESVLNDILKDNATSSAALVPLARIEAKRGDNAKALDHFMTASLTSQLKAADKASMESLFAKANGGKKDGLEAAIDKAYLAKFPNPVKPEEYKATAARTNKLVLLELFTGSGCPPCVASDLALEAAMERYADHVISIVYHEHIPQPDPMVAVNNNDRRLFYSVNGVPTFEIDGAMVANASGSNPGGGARANTTSVYTNYKASIDKALELPARAALNVKATGSNDTVNVTVNVTDVAADAKDLRLHIVLVEKELKFTGENGIRFHPMAVRSTAGDKGAGLPITGKGTFTYAFSLNQIRDEITKSLAADIARRRQTNTTGVFAAEDNAYTAINTDELMVVAFVQEGPYRAPKAATPPQPQQAPQPGQPLPSPAPRPEPGTPTASADPALMSILNAAKTDVVFAGATKTKGGVR